MISVQLVPLLEWIDQRDVLIKRVYNTTLLRPRPEPPAEDTVLLLAGLEGETVACCALCRNPGIRVSGEETLLLGWFESVESEDVAAALFGRAAEVAHAMGCRVLLGPINGDTWHSYRTVLPSSHPPFILDIASRPWYSSLFESAGWEVAESYHSTIMPPSPEANEACVMERLRHHGITVRPIDTAHYRADLASIYTLSLVAFTESPFYTPIGFDRFMEIYAPLEPLVDPDLVLVAEAAERETVGFVFALQDRFALPGECIVMKSAASSPFVRGAGVGSGLMEIIHSRARGRGCRTVIHALMHDNNRSARILSDGAETIRAYRLYQWTP